jgi:hypothetical protein
MTDVEGRTPAFPGRQPPFERGNDVAATHGCYSVLKNAKRADEIRERLTAEAPSCRRATRHCGGSKMTRPGLDVRRH